MSYFRQNAGDGILFFDVVIVGAGSMGLAAGYYLSQAGQKVLMIDAFDPPHERGSHGGETRLMRHASGEGVFYAPLALATQKEIDRIQAETSRPIFKETGIVTFGVPHDPVAHIARQAAETHNIHHETYSSGSSINQRFPGFNLPEESVALYEPRAGILDADNLITFYKEKAVEAGADLRTDEPVTAVEVKSSREVTVKTDKDTYTAASLVLTPGAYINRLLEDLDLELNLQTTRQTVAWFEVEEEVFGSESFPGFVGKVDEGCDCYGFPSFGGSGLKIGSYEFQQKRPEPEAVNFEFGAYEEDIAVSADFLERYFLMEDSSCIRGAVCMFTMTPDEDFIIDRHPDHENVAIAAGFSGHGFKYISAVGGIIRDLILGEESDFDLSPFSIQRPNITV